MSRGRHDGHDGRHAGRFCLYELFMIIEMSSMDRNEFVFFIIGVRKSVYLSQIPSNILSDKQFPCDITRLRIIIYVDVFIAGF